MYCMMKFDTWYLYAKETKWLGNFVIRVNEQTEGST